MSPKTAAARSYGKFKYYAPYELNSPPIKAESGEAPKDKHYRSLGIELQCFIYESGFKSVNEFAHSIGFGAGTAAHWLYDISFPSKRTMATIKEKNEALYQIFVKHEGERK